MSQEQINREKQAAAQAAAEMVRSGMVIGLGTGSTAEFAIHALAERVASGLKIVGIPTSKQSETLARSCGVPLTDFQSVDRVDLTIDGADEIEPRTLAVLKGRGGALVREKLVASASESMVIIADSSKVVSQLGSHHSVPVEVLPFGWHIPSKRLTELGGNVALRTISAGNSPFVSDNGNLILDVAFGPIDDPERLAASIKAITGVVDHGLFIRLADQALVGTDTGVNLLTPKR
ncbi:MAG: ribose-5-phosphate isomerase RpiA [Nitrolancea sp.]